jgi:peptidoglycan DL-endopeptidase CwlO
MVSSPRPVARPATALLFVAALLVGAAVPAAAQDTEYRSVKALARAQIGAPWVSAAVGPEAFDCSGFVYYVFREAGLLDRVGGTRRTAAGYWKWFASRGKASTTKARRGDLVIWGGGSHIGIYLGDGRAISALVRGVTVHGLHNLTIPFTTFLNVKLTR